MDGIPKITDVEAVPASDIAKRYGWTSLNHDASGNRTGNVVLITAKCPAPTMRPD